MSDDDETTFIETAEPTEAFVFEIPAELTLADLLTRQAKNVWRPDLSSLPDAVQGGKFLLKKGEKVIIEYPHEPWRDTTVWVVNHVFDTVESVAGTTCDVGHVRLYDPAKAQFGGTNYLSDRVLIKIPDGSKKWTQFGSETLQEMAKKKRRKFVRDEEDDDVVASTPAKAIEGEQKKRGRPKGSKNKSTLAKEAK